MEIPFYLFTGFLESGKTRLIQETLADPNFNKGERTLVLMCEEGELEYDTSVFPGGSVVIETLTRIEQVNRDKLSALIRKHGAQRVMVEYNGMWTLDALYNALPDNCVVYQEIFLVDSTTFSVYNANMRNLVVDKLQSAELVVFNRYTPDIDKMELHKIVRGISRRCDIVYEQADGKAEFDEIEDPLPFDINAPVIEIADRDYAFFYRDLTENLEGYIGKTVKFKGLVARDHRLSPQDIVIGRHVMTCCEADIEYSGFACVLPEAMDLQTRDWICVTGKIEFQKHRIYKGKGPVLIAERVIVCEQPEEQLATFY